ncbi:MAG: ComEC family competence protein, partial [Candidatus Daviesbacteria bacterium]|nr:ComEC family competence protein [Candidatus Daviesbacteria bacterium]
MHKSQVLLYILLAFIGGVFVASLLAISQTWMLVFLIVAITLIAISGYQRTYSKKGLIAGVLFLVLIFGIVRFNSFNFANSILNQFADVEVGGKGMVVQLNGYIDEEPDINGDKAQLVFRVKELIVLDPAPSNSADHQQKGRTWYGASKKLAINERTLVYTNAFPKYKLGDELLISGALKTPQNFVENFDYVAYLNKQKIRTIMSFPKISRPNADVAPQRVERLSRLEKTKLLIYKNIFSLKNKFELAINISISEPNASFVNGILLGSRQNIPEEIKNSFNKTGTTHILAISGYNIMIISWAVLAGLVYFFKRRTSFWISVAVIVLFTILTGASASVVRASLMGLLLLFANGYG